MLGNLLLIKLIRFLFIIQIIKKYTQTVIADISNMSKENDVNTIFGHLT